MTNPHPPHNAARKTPHFPPSSPSRTIDNSRRRKTVRPVGTATAGSAAVYSENREHANTWRCKRGTFGIRVAAQGAQTPPRHGRCAATRKHDHELSLRHPVAARPAGAEGRDRGPRALVRPRL